MRLLAVDDDRLFAELIETSLASSDRLDVVTAASGQDALRILDRDGPRFDCLLFDIRMPRMDGITLCRRVRRDPLHAHTPIIMLTAAARKQDLEAAFAAGASDYLTKPLASPDLLDKLHRWHRRDLAATPPAPVTDAFGTPAHVAARGTEAALIARLCTLDLPGHVAYRAFENFCVRRARRRLGRLRATALQIANFDRLQADMPPDRFAAAVIRFAHTLAQAVGWLDGLFSYRGRGIFLIAHAGAPDPLEPRLHLLLRRAARAAPPDLARLQSHIRYTVGATIPIGRADDAIFALGDSVRSVQDRHIARSLDRVPPDMLNRMYHEAELSHLEARAYRGMFDADMRHADVTWPPPDGRAAKG